LKDKKNEEKLSTGEEPKSIYFGEGVVDFQGLSRWLKQSGYHGNLVLESYFDKALADLQRNLSYLRSL
jgi:L-ribulose-5-phosphate 3-epimerase UlaE